MRIYHGKKCVHLLGPFVIRLKLHKENLHTKALSMIYLITGLFKMTQYNNKIAISIANLVETMWLSRYSIPTEITYDQGSEFIRNEFRKSLTEREYGITAKPITSRKPTSNTILEWIHQVMVNLVLTFNILKKPMLTKMTHGWDFYL